MSPTLLLTGANGQLAQAIAAMPSSRFRIVALGRDQLDLASEAG